MRTETTTLLKALRGKQRADGLNDAGLARKLGVSRSLVSLIVNGKSEPTIKFVRGVLRAYPDLGPEVSIFLRSEDRIVNTR